MLTFSKRDANVQTPSSFCPPEGALTVTEIRETAAALATLVQGGDAMTIDLREAGEIDVSGLQLLIAAQRSAERANNQISILADRGGTLEQALVRAGLLGADGAPRSAREQAWADMLNKGTQPA